MRAQVNALFSPESEEQLDSIVDGICDVMREHGFAAKADPDPDDEIASIVIVSPTPELENPEEFLELMVKGAYKVAIPSEEAPAEQGKIVVPIGQVNETSEVNP